MKKQQILAINDELTWRAKFDMDHVYQQLKLADFSIVNMEDKIGSILYELPELRADLQSSNFEKKMVLSKSYERFAFFVTASWAEIGREDLCNDRQPGGLAAKLLNISQKHDRQVIAGGDKPTTLSLIERFVCGDSIWIGPVTDLLMPPMIQVGGFDGKFWSLRGLEGKLKLEFIKYIDCVMAIRDGQTYPSIIREQGSKFPYFGIFYMKQGLLQDREAEQSLREACESIGASFATESEGIKVRPAQRALADSLWRRFLADVDSQFKEK